MRFLWFLPADWSLITKEKDKELIHVAKCWMSQTKRQEFLGKVIDSNLKQRFQTSSNQWATCLNV